MLVWWEICHFGPKYMPIFESSPSAISGKIKSTEIYTNWIFPENAPGDGPRIRIFQEMPIRIKWWVTCLNTYLEFPSRISIILLYHFYAVLIGAICDILYAKNNGRKSLLSQPVNFGGYSVWKFHIILYNQLLTNDSTYLSACGRWYNASTTPASPKRVLLYKFNNMQAAVKKNFFFIWNAKNWYFWKFAKRALHSRNNLITYIIAFMP